MGEPESMVPQPTGPDPKRLDAEVLRLASLDRRTYQAERKDAAKRLGWTVAFLDEEVDRLRPADPEQPCDGDIVEQLDPWEEPVDGLQLAELIRKRIANHVIFASRHELHLLTLWVLGAYLVEVWRLWPKVLITSPTRQCGKSTLMEVLEALLPRALLASNATPAAIFRTIESYRPSLLLDEADTWVRQNEDLAGIINSGHTRRTAWVLRTVEVSGEHRPRRFSTWGPMVVAGIGNQRDTLVSRSLVIALRRKLPGEKTTRLPVDLFDRLRDLRRQMMRWAQDVSAMVAALDLDPPPSGDDRRRDNFGPLFRVAAVLGGPWPARVEAGYLATAQATDEDDEPAGVMLLRDLVEIFARHRSDWISSSVLVADLIEAEDRPWAEWRHGRPMTAQSLAKLLKPFGIKPRVMKLGKETARAYLRHEIEAAAERYVPTEAASKCNPVTDEENQQVIEYSACNPEPEVTDNRPVNVLKSNNGYGVTDRAPGDCDTAWEIEL